ncbi:hypothetical protein RRG08_032429 [Elysia crispata]|uniref:Uncharacterized protein n=1 Tax=Elysia crispata TaxID=231223 RepID=A0AAE0XNW0_9GAST|nr:hypothetical protein RRG08_032429 [Elysia crispata]
MILGPINGSKAFAAHPTRTDPGQWIPPVRARPIEEGAIAVKIGHSPPELNLTQFKVMLVKRSSDEYSAFRTTFYTEPIVCDAQLRILNSVVKYAGNNLIVSNLPKVDQGLM